MIRLVIHAPTKAALERARRNLRNLLAADPDAQVELVANGAAVRVAVEEPDAGSDGHLVLCRNSLRAADLAAPQGIATADAAVLHIARRQAEGWGYFRA